MDAGRGAWRGRGRATPARKDESAYLRRGLQHQAPLGHAPARHCPHEPVLLHLVLLVKPKPEGGGTLRGRGSGGRWATAGLCCVEGRPSSPVCRGQQPEGRCRLGSRNAVTTARGSGEREHSIFGMINLALFASSHVEIMK